MQHHNSKLPSKEAQGHCDPSMNRNDHLAKGEGGDEEDERADLNHPVEPLAPALKTSLLEHTEIEEESIDVDLPSTKTYTTHVMALTSAINDMNAWLTEHGTQECSIISFMQSYLAHMAKLGIPCCRFFIGSDFIQSTGCAFIWKVDASGPIVDQAVPRDIYDRRYDIFGIDAPWNMLQAGARCILFRNTDAYIPQDSRKMFSEHGFVELFGLPYYYRDAFSTGITWATKDRSGFAKAHFDFFEQTASTLGAIVQLLIQQMITQRLLCKHLGEQIGCRLLAGSLAHGAAVEVRDAVMWQYKIRQADTMTDLMSRSALMHLTDDVLATVEPVVRKFGGEIITIEKDGALAAFKSRGCHSHRNCTENARKAATEVQRRMHTLRSERSAKDLPGASMEIVVALHFGSYSYGVVGSSQRQGSVAIGRAIDIVHSLTEYAARVLSSPVVATRHFVSLDSNPLVWTAGIQHKVKDNLDPLTIFELSFFVSTFSGNGELPVELISSGTMTMAEGRQRFLPVERKRRRSSDCTP